MRLEIFTMVDVTQTGSRRDGVNGITYAQQANFNTLLQTASLRSNLILISEEQKKGEIKALGFGSEFKGRQKYWSVIFETERNFDTLTLSMLEDDFDLVPIVINLTETAKFSQPVFNTKSLKDKNIIFRLVTN